MEDEKNGNFSQKAEISENSLAHVKNLKSLFIENLRDMIRYQKNQNINSVIKETEANLSLDNNQKKPEKKVVRRVDDGTEEYAKFNLKIK